MIMVLVLRGSAGCDGDVTIISGCDGGVTDVSECAGCDDGVTVV